MIPVQKHLRSSAGFTLVELAIVMIIIGLLIAGVLKGQALIANAQVTSTVAQMKAIEAATTTFKDTYNAIPGDIVNPANRLPNCGGACILGAGVTNGDGILANTPNLDPSSTEGEAYFPQLNAAGLMTSISPAATTSKAIGVNYPATKIANNAIQMSYSPLGAAGNFPLLIGATSPDSGLYATVTAAIGAPSVGLKPDQAGRVDTKMDDGAPDTGLVRAGGAVGNVSPDCGTTVVGASGVYTTMTTIPACEIYIHMQN